MTHHHQVAPLAKARARKAGNPRASCQAAIVGSEVYRMRMAPSMPKDAIVLINLSGRGDKDVDYVAEVLSSR